MASLVIAWCNGCMFNGAGAYEADFAFRFFYSCCFLLRFAVLDLLIVLDLWGSFGRTATKIAPKGCTGRLFSMRLRRTSLSSLSFVSSNSTTSSPE
jgi:hypothetical protein